MKLAIRLTALSFVVLVIAVSLHSYGSIRRELDLFDQDMQRDAELLGQSLAHTLDTLRRHDDFDQIQEIVKHINATSHGIQVRIIARSNLQAEVANLSPSEFQRLKNGQILSVVRPSKGRPAARYTFVSLPQDASYVIEMIESFERRDRFVRKTLLRISVLAIIVCVVGLGALWYSSHRWVGKPLRNLGYKLDSIAKGKPEAGSVTDKGSELFIIDRAMDELIANLSDSKAQTEREHENRIEAERQLQHVQRLAVLGRLAAGIAHEMGTPLNVISGRAQLLGTGKPDPEEIQRGILIIQSQVDRMTETIERILTFSRRDPPKRYPHDLVREVKRAVRLFEPFAERKEISIEARLPVDETLVEIDRGQISQVIGNLLINGIQASSPGGKVRIRIRQRPQGAEMWVIDSGRGIDPTDQPEVFEPFFTTKPPEEGTGLGLSICREIVRAHGGTIRLGRSTPKGSVFRVLLPYGGPA